MQIQSHAPHVPRPLASCFGYFLQFVNIFKVFVSHLPRGTAKIKKNYKKENKIE